MFLVKSVIPELTFIKIEKGTHLNPCARCLSAYTKMDMLETMIHFTFLVTSTVASSNEPLCPSRFDFEYKTLNKLIELEQRMKETENIIQEQRVLLGKLSTEGGGSVYVRWGRNGCPADASLVYNGYIGGKYYSELGSGSDSLCLPSDPSWLNFTDGLNGDKARIYGTETDLHPDDEGDFFQNDVDDQDMPCAVCKTLKSTSLMIPARTTCYSSWQLEYVGYLMSAYHGHNGPHSHICVDVMPDFLPNGGGNSDQHILYLVEAVCGSLPCPPYVNGRELACVVCSY